MTSTSTPSGAATMKCRCPKSSSRRAMNEAALWIAGAADRDRALREAWDSLPTLLRAVVRPGAGA